MISMPASEEDYQQVEVLRGPNIKPLPKAMVPQDSMELPVLLKVGDNITTDHIMPAGAKVLPFRSNIPKIANFCFEKCDPTFHDRALAAGGGVIVGGSNYGQGSSREHAALVPLYLGIRAVIAVSFARIHKANLVNAGILPLEFADPADFTRIEQGDKILLEGVREGIRKGQIQLRNLTRNESYPLVCALSARQCDIIAAGGLLNYTKAKAEA